MTKHEGSNVCWDADKMLLPYCRQKAEKKNHFLSIKTNIRPRPYCFVLINQQFWYVLLQVVVDMVFLTDYGHPMKAKIKETWKFRPMWQTKYAAAIPKKKLERDPYHDFLTKKETTSRFFGKKLIDLAFISDKRHILNFF